MEVSVWCGKEILKCVIGGAGTDHNISYEPQSQICVYRIKK